MSRVEDAYIAAMHALSLCPVIDVGLSRGGIHASREADTALLRLADGTAMAGALWFAHLGG